MLDEISVKSLKVAAEAIDGGAVGWKEREDGRTTIWPFVKVPCVTADGGRCNDGRCSRGCLAFC